MSKKQSLNVPNNKCQATKIRNKSLEGIKQTSAEDHKFQKVRNVTVKSINQMIKLVANAENSLKAKRIISPYFKEPPQ